MPNIMLGKSPERDCEIEILQDCIRVAGKTGVGLLTYKYTQFFPLCVQEELLILKEEIHHYSTWNYEEALKKNEPKHNCRGCPGR